MRRWFAVLIGLGFSFITANGNIPSSEREALISLYSATAGPAWFNQDNWLGEPGSEGSWYGIVCDDANSHVVAVELGGNNLTGSLPPAIGAFPALTGLLLNDNHLSENLPPELGDLSELVWLDLARNQFGGELPETMGSLLLLEYLDASSNLLTGPLPAAMAGLKRLRYLFLGDNSLTGPIPAWLGTLPELLALSLNYNQFTGSIPAELGRVANLTDLDLTANQLGGPIPPGLGNLAQLVHLYLSDNALTGTIPPEFGDLAQLEVLDLFDNLLTGDIPPELGRLAALRTLALGMNQLSGEIPGQLGNLLHLEVLYLGSNQLTGEIPASFGALTSLQLLAVPLNRLTGSIPPEVGNLAQLRDLDLAGNYLSGSIPDSLGQLPYLQTLALGGNALSGRIPASLAGLSDLNVLVLGANRLSGAIPPELGQLQALTYLLLDDNRLSGPIPASFAGLSQLGVLNLSNNQLDGGIPAWFGGLTALRELYLGSNQFTGEIPPALGNLPDLTGLDLSGNQLSGNIPQDLSNLHGLRYLGLAWNRLGGEIPAALGYLEGLQDLNLEWNHLEGPVPAALGQATRLQRLALSGNRLSGVIPSELGSLSTLERMQLAGNQLTGEIPAALANLVQLADNGGLDLRWNALFTADPSLRSFLEQKHEPGGYADTETLPPADFSASRLSYSAVRLAWVPVTFLSEGGYEIWSATAPEGPFSLRERIPDKTATTCTAYLFPDSPTCFIIRSYSLPHGMNQSALASVFSPAVQVEPAVEPSGTVQILFDPQKTGSLFQSSPSQILPASYLTFLIDPGAFAGASPDNPMVIELGLPPGASLSQSLADGTTETSAPLPGMGETVVDLAVSEYALNQKGRAVPVSSGKSLPSISPQAVQILRYQEGERSILLRVTESTSGWQSSMTGNLLGFTIGLGSGVWPESEASNWGGAGIRMQPSTLFYANLTDYRFDQANNMFPISVCAYPQRRSGGAGPAFAPPMVNLFTWNGESQTQTNSLSRLQSTTQDFVLIDLNGDGREDYLYVNGISDRLYWIYGQPDGTFRDFDWREITGIVPQTIDAADISGDGRPDVLVSDRSGTLTIFFWEDLFGNGPLSTKISSVTMAMQLAGTPADSLLSDLNADGHSDYAYVDSSTSKLVVLMGNGFNPPGADYATGAGPRSLTVGDFDANLAPDLAAANRDGNSLTILLNNGLGSFTLSQVPGIGSHPVDIDSADFNRDGRADLAVALAGDQALAALIAQPGGSFDIAHEQKIYFLPNTPSAVQTENFDGQNGPDALVGYSDYYKLALCTSDSAGVLSHTFNLDTRGDVEIDPFNEHVTMQADRVIAVASGTSYGGVVSQQGVAVIQDRGIGVLHFPRSKDISFSVVNLGAQDSLLTLELYNDTSGAPVTACTQSVASGTQFVRYLADLLGSEAANPLRWVRGFSTAPDLYGFWLVNNGADLTYLDGARIMDVRDAGTDLIFPVIYTGSGRNTSIILVNPSKDQSHVVLRLRDGNGALKGAVYPLTMGGRTRRVLDARTIFPALAETDSIRLTADRAIIGEELFGTGVSVACLEAMPPGSGDGLLYCPHIAVGNFGVEYESYLTLVNPSASAGTVSVSLFNDSGVSVATRSVELPAGGKCLLNLAQFFDLVGAVTGYLRVNPNATAGLAGSILFGESGTGGFLSCLPLQPVGHNKYLLGHIANGTIGSVAFFTGIAVLNGETGAAVEIPVQLSAFDQNGLPLDSRTILLHGGERSVFLLDQFMPELTSIFGGYILVENLSSSEGILVFELFGDQNLQFLSAVPAIPLD